VTAAPHPPAAPAETVVVDAHVPVGELPHLLQPDLDALLRRMDQHGVERAVLGPVGRWAAVDDAEGNQVLAGWARRHPDRLRHWATANPWYGRRAVERLHRAAADGAVGIKVDPARQGTSLLSAVLDPVLDAAEELALPVYVVTGVPVAAEPLQLAELALQRPATTFVMGRSGRTDFSLDILPALRTSTNLVAETAYNAAGLVAQLVQELGAGRVVFASDTPLNELGLELERVHRAGLSPADLAAVLGGTAGRLVGWDGTDRAEEPA
jgi:predicted TIM-barrel fold metal-dependent hydrolase